MDFFEHQDKARRSTKFLFLYFVLAIIGIVFSVNIAFYLFNFLGGNQSTSILAWFQSVTSLYVTLGTLLVIAVGSAWRFWILSDGGQSIIRMSGAQEVTYDHNNKHTQQLLNVVEEMAIASGVPVPAIYVMPTEASINAFVTGYDSDDAILVVTQGLLENLNRDELQGVVGHEFSHLLNGDVRINMRLMALLGGILAIGQLGEGLLRGGFNTRNYNRSGSFHGAQFAIGLTLLAIGYIGLFFGRMIKAAISRQREYLADASAVQFTRNKLGIGEALLKIKNASVQYLNSPNAEDISHMCISPTLQFHFFAKRFATHPPIDERIKAIDPSLLARDRARNRAADKEQQHIQQVETQTAMGFTGGEIPLEPKAFTPQTSVATDTPLSVSSEQLISNVGAPQAQHLEYAHSIYSLVPLELKAFFHHQQYAPLSIYAMIIAFSDNKAHDTAFEYITMWHDEEATEYVSKRANDIKQLGTRLRIPITDLCAPALKRLDQEDTEAFLIRCEQLILLDQKYTLFEFTLLALLRNQLRASKKHNKHIKKVPDACYQRLLSLCAHAGGGNTDVRQQRFQQAREVLHIKGMDFLPPSSVNAIQLADDLYQFSQLAPMRKKLLLGVIADIFLTDKMLQVAEAELIRGICESLHVPMPPLLNSAA